MRIFPDYFDFFLKQKDQRYVHLIGGRRSGKTINVFLWVRLLSKVRRQPITVLVVDSTYPALKNTIQDFTLATGLIPKNSLTTGISIQDANVTWIFSHYDEPTKAQGVRCDYLIVQEAVRVRMDVLEVLVQGVVSQIYTTSNPTKQTGIKRWMNDANTMWSTFKNNPTLGDAQISEFELLKERAQRPTATKRDIYLYTVYYLGKFSDISGQIFDNVTTIADEDYFSLPAQEIYGLDFGFAASSSADPTVLVGVKYRDRKIYIHEYFYRQGLTNDEELAHLMHDCGCTPYTPIAADFGGLGKCRIEKLISADNGQWTDEDIRQGFGVFPCHKTSVFDGIMEMLSTDGICLTRSSVNTREEFDSYELDGEKFSGADHAIDAARYAFHYIKNFLIDK